MNESLYTPDGAMTPPSGTVNIYPFLRKVFFVFVIVLFVALALFLIYHNGKSIYDNGI